MDSSRDLEYTKEAELFFSAEFMTIVVIRTVDKYLAFLFGRHMVESHFFAHLNLCVAI